VQRARRHQCHRFEPGLLGPPAQFADGEPVPVGGREGQLLAVDLDSHAGEDFVVAFNPSYLLDGLGAVGSTTTRLDFTTPTKPAVLRAGDGGEGDGGSAADEYRYLLMPVRLSG
jgi:DNA polymerase-3 subunit beta